MNRVWTALLIALTAVVLGGVVYTLGHSTTVPQAGETPGYTPPAPSSAATSATTPTTPPASAGSTHVTSPAGNASSTSNTSTLIAFVGDDYTQGVGGSGSASTFPSLIAADLHVQEKSFSADGAGYAKAGPSGQTYGDLVSAVIAAHPDVVVVSGGRNDRPDDPTTLSSKATALFAALKQGLPSAKIVAVAPWWGDSAAPAVLQQIGTTVQQAVTAAGGTYLDLADPLFGHSDWMADAADPNDQGYLAIAESLEPKLQALLPS